MFNNWVQSDYFDIETNDCFSYWFFKYQLGDRIQGFNFENSSNYTEKTLLIWMQNSFVLLLSLSRNLYHDLAIYIFAWEIFYCLRSLALNHAQYIY